MKIFGYIHAAAMFIFAPFILYMLYTHEGKLWEGCLIAALSAGLAVYVPFAFNKKMLTLSDDTIIFGSDKPSLQIPLIKIEKAALKRHRGFTILMLKFKNPEEFRKKNLVRMAKLSFNVDKNFDYFFPIIGLEYKAEEILKMLEQRISSANKSQNHLI